MMETLKRSEVLRGRRDVALVFREGRRVPGGPLYLRWRQRPESETAGDCLPPRRVAFLLARGVGNAVRRNRLKRRLRELYRRNKQRFPEGRDYLLHAGPGAGELGFAELDRQLAAVCRPLRRRDED